MESAEQHAEALRPVARYVTRSERPNDALNAEASVVRHVAAAMPISAASAGRSGENVAQNGIAEALPRAKFETQRGLQERREASRPNAGIVAKRVEIIATVAETERVPNGAVIAETRGGHTAMAAGTPIATAATGPIAMIGEIRAGRIAMDAGTVGATAIAAIVVGIIAINDAPIATDAGMVIAQDSARGITMDAAGTITASGTVATGGATRATTGIAIALLTADYSRSGGIIRPIVRIATAGLVSGSFSITCCLAADTGSTIHGAIAYPKSTALIAGSAITTT